MEPIRATIPAAEPPAWAAAQRHLLAAMAACVEPYTEAYCEADGSLVWRHDSAHSLDDFYEAFCNWPLLYLIGGADDLLARSHRHWEAVTRQLTRFGLVKVGSAEQRQVNTNVAHYALSSSINRSLPRTTQGRSRPR